MLKLDVEKHIYTYNGRFVPSVSEILKESGLVDLSKIPPDILESARIRGECVHKALESFDLGFLDIDKCPNETRPYLMAWARFLSEKGGVVKKIEYSDINIEHWYAGTIDRIVDINGESILLDVKSGGKTKSHQVQLAAYQEMLNPKPTSRGILYLNSKGEYEWIEQSNEEDFKIWFYARQIYAFKYPRKGRIK